MMAEAPPHVGTIVALFAKKDKRGRLLYLASKEARRGDFCDALSPPGLPGFLGPAVTWKLPLGSFSVNPYLS